MFLIIVFAVGAISTDVDNDGHKSFSQHFANGVSYLYQYRKQQSKFIMLKTLWQKDLSRPVLLDVKSALDMCIERASENIEGQAINDDSLVNQCYSIVFGDDYFWLK